jgi:hypothetical protein
MGGVVSVASPKPFEIHVRRKSADVLVSASSARKPASLLIAAIRVASPKPFEIHVRRKSVNALVSASSAPGLLSPVFLLATISLEFDILQTQVVSCVCDCFH